MKYIPPPASKFKYEFNGDHVWYDEKIHGTVFTYSSGYYSKEKSFKHLEKEVGKMRGEWRYIKEELLDLIKNGATTEDIKLFINRL